MTTITDAAAITEAFAKFEAGKNGAFATGRCLPGQWEQGNCQEWAEHGTINEAPAKVYYMFENSECESEDAGDYPWDAAHISKIEVAEKYEDGYYERI
jgi:hypothetical protein